jgi:hypothetical protein
LDVKDPMPWNDVSDSDLKGVLNMKNLIIFIILSVPVISIAEGADDRFKIPRDDPKEFNWTNPDLFRWNLYIDASFDSNYIEDKEDVILRGEGWSCKVTKPKRETWTIKNKRYFMESRKVICLSGSFKSQIETSCRLGMMAKSTVLVDASSVWMEVGVGKKLNPISLRCETWYDTNQNNKNDSFEWQSNIDNWEPKPGDVVPP